MKVLVTGANGLLGQKLVKLLAPVSTLVATGKGQNRNPDGEALYTYIPSDLTRKEDVENLIGLSKPDVVIHCAAMTQVDECELDQKACEKANVDATRFLLDSLHSKDIFFLYVSTDFVFDGTKGPLNEDERPNPVSFYGKSKLQAEQLVQESGLKWAIVRTVLVYGVAHDPSRSNIILWVKKSLEEKKTINVVNDQFRTPTLAEDLAIGCWLVAKGQHEGIFHISGEEMLTPFQIAMRTASFFGLDASLITPADASTFVQPGKRPPKTGFIIDKARKRLGFEPRTFEEGLGLLKRQLGAASL